MTRFLLAVLVLLCLPASSQAYELSAADDQALLASNRAGTLESMQAHGVARVRLMAFSDRPYDYALRSAAAASALGLKVSVVLSPWHGSDPGPTFTAWATTAARDFSPYADRFYVLNEPDLWIPATDLCDTDAEIRRTLSSSGYRIVVKTVKRKVKVTKLIVYRKHGKKIRKRVVVYRTVKVRVVRIVKGHRRHVTVKRRVPRTKTKLVRMAVAEPISSSIDVVERTPRTGCLAIQRARIAAASLRSAVPAIRAAAPGAEVGAGGTSPVAGVQMFIDEWTRAPLPRLDFFSHHPYPGPFAEGGLEAAESIFNLYRKVRAVPQDWTEFGTQVRTSTRDPQTLAQARANWDLMTTKALRLGVRTVTAYGWWATGASWDSAAEGVLH